MSNNVIIDQLLIKIVLESNKTTYQVNGRLAWKIFKREFWHSNSGSNMMLFLFKARNEIP